MPSISTASFFSATSFSLGLNLSAVISVVMLRRSQSLHLRHCIFQCSLNLMYYGTG
ncbi:uncharacterized protein DS421_18g618060 [Arachis hypogaea]|nr:uncharacterized protein DS421_18g618060 [Arachis hypogaea]